jgi:hypothetical protein
MMEPIDILKAAREMPKKASNGSRSKLYPYKSTIRVLRDKNYTFREITEFLRASTGKPFNLTTVQMFAKQHLDNEHCL